MPQTTAPVWPRDRLQHWLPEAWRRGLAAALAELRSGDADDVEVVAREAEAGEWKRWGQTLWLRQGVADREEAEVAVGLPKETAEALAARAEEGDDRDPEQVCRKLLERAGEEVADALGDRWGRPVRLAAPTAGEPIEERLAVVCSFELDGDRRQVAFACNEALGSILDGAAETALTKPPVSDETDEAASLGILEDVEVELAVSFGETVLTLADALKLSSGSIVELNRAVSDPVEVLVNNSLVARGEVVVVDGNYGVRITEVVSRSRRMRSAM